jgi:hypothetical protein
MQGMQCQRWKYTRKYTHPCCMAAGLPCRGFALMVVSVIWSANLASKVRQAWSQISLGGGLE